MPGTGFRPGTIVGYGALTPAAVPTTMPVAVLIPGVVSFDEGS